MTITNAAAVDAAAKNAHKGQEKLAEKRRALGRGLESLLPGPRVVGTTPGTAPGGTPTLPPPAQSTRKDGAPAVVSSVETFSGADAERAGTHGAPSHITSSAVASSHVTSSNVTSSSMAMVEGLHASGQVPDGEHAFELDLDQVEENPYQTRMIFDPKALAELAASIQTQGVLQPIVVRPAPRPALRPELWPGVPTAAEPAVHPAATETAEGDAEVQQTAGTEKERFILILGERRFRASRMAGKTTIPAIVKRVSEQQAAEMTLVENLQRQDLNCMEQAQAYSNLSTKFHLTQDEIGKRAGVSREQVSNYMRLLNLPVSVIGALQTGKLTFSHARTLLHLKNHEEIWKFAKMAMEENMSVSKLEDLVLGVSTSFGREPSKRGGARWVDPNVKAAQRSLEEVLGMRVRIRDRKGRGRILIEYATIDDFDRVVGMLKGGQ